MLVSYVQILNDKGQVKYKTSPGLFEVLSEKFMPQHKKKLLSLQYCKK